MGKALTDEHHRGWNRLYKNKAEVDRFSEPCKMFSDMTSETCLETTYLMLGVGFSTDL